tara:strand:- start:57965 stop:58105 length:141 start_codon:yes stop_codon:yes gene_type:complete
MDLGFKRVSFLVFPNSDGSTSEFEFFHLPGNVDKFKNGYSLLLKAI